MPHKKGTVRVELGFDPTSSMWKHLASDAEKYEVSPSLFIKLLLADRDNALYGQAHRHIWFPGTGPATPLGVALLQGNAQSSPAGQGVLSGEEPDVADAAADYWALGSIPKGEVAI